MTTVVHLLLNDPSNGVPTGRCDGVEFAFPTGDEISLSLYTEPGPEAAVRAVEGVAHLVLGGKRYRIVGHRGWVGNWCWDAVRMEPAVALRLLEDLRADAGRWCVEMATGDLMERWQQGGPFPAELGATEASHAPRE